jgi:hypothetical protein
MRPAPEARGGYVLKPAKGFFSKAQGVQMNSEQSPPASGFQTLADVIVAPASAFERLRTQPTWGWAFIVAIVGATIGAYFTIPAIMHGTQASWASTMAANPRTAALSPAEQQRSLQIVLNFMRFSWIFTIVFVPIAIFIFSIIMLLFSAIGRGSASFASMWAVACNIAVVSAAIASIVTGITVSIRGASSFNSPQSVTAAVPSLALFAASAGPKLYAFLGGLNVFSIWAAALVYVAMRKTARIGTVPATIAALILLVIPALLGAVGAR